MRNRMGRVVQDRHAMNSDLLTGNNRELAVSHFIYLVLTLFSVFYSRNIRVPFTNSGVFMIYGNDILAIFSISTLFLFFILSFIFNKKTFGLEKNNKFIITFISFIAFLVYCFTVSLFRSQNNSNELQSLLIPRAIISSYFVLLYIVLLRPKKEIIITAHSVFIIILSLITIMLGLFQHNLSYKIFQNHSVRTHALLLLFPLTLRFSLNSKLSRAGSLLFQFSFFFHLYSLVFSSILTGARMIFILLLLNLFVLITIAIINKEFQFRKLILSIIIIVISLVSVFLIAGHNQYVKERVVRSPIYPLIYNEFTTHSLKDHNNVGKNEAIFDKHQENNRLVKEPIVDNNNEKVDDIELINEAEKSKGDSISVRFVAWKDAIEEIKANPFFGPGYKQFIVTYERVNNRSLSIPPHNFILEYVLAYGFIGLAFFFMLITLPLKSYFTFNKSFTTKKTSSYITLLAMLATVFMAAFVQPLLINPAFLVLFFYSLGNYSNLVEVDG